MGGRGGRDDDDRDKHSAPAIDEDNQPHRKRQPHNQLMRECKETRVIGRDLQSCRNTEKKASQDHHTPSLIRWVFSILKKKTEKLLMRGNICL